MLDKLQKRVCRTVGVTLATSLDPSAVNIASLSLLYNCLLGKCSNVLTKFAPFLILEVGRFVILIGCMIFMSPFQDVIRLSIAKVSLLLQLHCRTVSLFNAFY